MDYDNLFFTLREVFGIAPTEKISKTSIVDIILNTYKEDHIMICNAYADFQVITNLARETNTMYELQSRRVNIRHVFGSLSKNDNRKNASDIELSIDIMESLFKNPEINRYVIVSADSDMIPIMNRLKYADKEIILYYLRSSCSQAATILSYADKNIPIEMLVDLVSLKICEHDIREKYLDYILEKIIKIDIQNKQSDSGNYIGLTWIKNQLQSKNFIQIDGEGVSFSGSNASIILEFLTENGYIINLVEDKISKIIPNYGNEYVKEILNKTTSHD
jgi:hypothetical protein